MRLKVIDTARPVTGLQLSAARALLRLGYRDAALVMAAVGHTVHFSTLQRVENTDYFDRDALAACREVYEGLGVLFLTKNGVALADKQSAERVAAALRTATQQKGAKNCDTKLVKQLGAIVPGKRRRACQRRSNKEFGMLFPPPPMTLREWEALLPAERDGVRTGFIQLTAPVTADMWPETETGWKIVLGRFDHARRLNWAYAGQKTPVSVDEMTARGKYRYWRDGKKFLVVSPEKVLTRFVKWITTVCIGRKEMPLGPVGAL